MYHYTAKQLKKLEGLAESAGLCLYFEDPRWEVYYLGANDSALFFSENLSEINGFVYGYKRRSREIELKNIASGEKNARI